MTALQTTILLLVAAGGTAVVATRDPLRQAMVASLCVPSSRIRYAPGCGLS